MRQNGARHQAEAIGCTAWVVPTVLTPGSTPLSLPIKRLNALTMLVDANFVV